MLEKIEENINKYKRKFDHRTWGILAYVMFGAALLYGMQMANMFRKQKQIVQDNYNKAMYELVNYMENVDVLISKARITTTPVEASKTYADIWRQSNLAKENLASLPVNQNAMANTSRFLAQVSDYAYVLMKQTVEGQKLSDEQYKNLEEINDEGAKLSAVLNDIYMNLDNGKLKWNEVEKQGDEKLPEGNDKGEVMSNISKISKTFTEYEGLIYDGAYSNHILTLEPVMLKDKEEVTSDEAKSKVEEVLKNASKDSNIEYINYIDETDGKLNVYNFEAKYKGSEAKLHVEITKVGGMLSLFVSDREVKEKIKSPEECEKIGIEYLKNIGIESVKSTYYLEIENMITINYAAVQDGVTLYPDLVKVKIAMDTGEICSVETTGYLFNHKKRENITPAITLKEAKEVLNKNIEILSEGIAIIPTDAKNEVLVYEFKGKINNKEFMIYVNAKTKQEEKVLLIINTPGGTLTM